MKTYKLIGMSIVCLVLLLSLSAVSYGLGVAPAIDKVTYEPGKIIEKNLLIVNTEKIKRTLVIFADGEFAEYTTFDKTLLTFTAGQESQTITYRIELPPGVAQPGEHKTQIRVLEMPEEGSTNQVSANLQVSAVTVVQVPYPGKYLEGELFIPEMEADQTGTFTISLFNYGKSNLDQVSGLIEIFGPTWEKVGEVRTNTVSLDASNKGKVTAAWKAVVRQGTYHIVATVDYDGKKLKLEKSMNVGSLYIAIKNIIVDNFKLGDVAKFDIELLNLWNEKLSNVFAEMTVSDKSGAEMTNFKTVALDLDPGEYGTLEGYWYTKGVAVGLYDLKLVVNYAGKFTEKLFEIEVQPDSITAQDQLFLTGRAVSADDKDAVTQGTLIMIVGILIIINIFFIVYFSRKLKRRNNG